MRRSDIEEIEFLLDEDPSEAVALARRIVAEHDDDPDAWGWLAEAQIEEGDFDAALQSLAEYIKRDPDWLEAYTMRAQLLTDLGNFEAAGIELEVARAIDSEDPRLLRSQALHAELQGRFEEADGLYGRAAEADPNQPMPARFDRDKARGAIQKVLREVARDGLKLQVVFEEVPKKASARKLLSRGLELRDSHTVVVYLRNLERELDDEAAVEELAELFEDRLAELVEAS